MSFLQGFQVRNRRLRDHMEQLEPLGTEQRGRKRNLRCSGELGVRKYQNVSKIINFNFFGNFSYFAGMWYDVNCDIGGIGVICQDRAMEPAKGMVSSVILHSDPYKKFPQTLRSPITGRDTPSSHRGQATSTRSNGCVRTRVRCSSSRGTRPRGRRCMPRRGRPGRL